MYNEFLKNIKKSQKSHIIKHKNTINLIGTPKFEIINRKGIPPQLFEYLLEAENHKIMLTAYLEIDYSTAGGKYLLRKILENKVHPLTQELSRNKSEISETYYKILEMIPDNIIQESHIIQDGMKKHRTIH